MSALERLAGSRGRFALLGALALAAAAGWLLAASDLPQLPWWRRYTRLALAGNALASAAVLGIAVALLPGAGAVRRLRRLAVLAGAAAAAAALVEVPAVLGHDWRESLGTLGPEELLAVPIRANRLDPELIHLHHAHGRFAGRVHGNLTPLGIPAEPYEVDVRYDANGFRNGRDLERADVAVVGDSFIEAALVALPDTLPARIERETGLVAANLGQAAYGLRQELAVLRRFALPLRPRLVVWCLFGGNDLRDVDTYEEQRAAFDRLPELVRPKLADRLFAASALRRLERALEPDGLSPGALAHSGLFRAADGTDVRVFFRAAEGPWAPHELEVAVEVLGEAAELCRAAGARLLVLYVPRKFRALEGIAAFESGSRPACWTSNDLPAVLAERCAELAIAFEDTTPALRARAAAGELPYFPDDVHWNAAGHAAACEVVLGRARAEGWLP